MRSIVRIFDGGLKNALIALMVAMAAGLLGPFGFIGSFIIFIVISALGYVILR